MCNVCSQITIGKIPRECEVFLRDNLQIFPIGCLLQELNGFTAELKLMVMKNTVQLNTDLQDALRSIPSLGESPMFCLHKLLCDKSKLSQA